MGTWLVATHVTALLVLPFAMLPAWTIPPVAAAVLFSLWWCWPRYASRRSKAAIRSFTWQEGCSCEIERAGGDITPATLAPRAFILPWLVILYFRQSGYWQYNLVVLPDMLDSESFRRLRVRLKMEVGQVTKMMQERACPR